MKVNEMRKEEASVSAPVDRVVHTPGPWEVKGPTQNGHCLRIFAGDEYVGIIGGSDQPMRVIHANAKLIAAAPELQAALEKFVAWHDMDHERIKPEEVQAAYNKAIDAAKTALRKVV